MDVATKTKARADAGQDPSTTAETPPVTPAAAPARPPVNWVFTLLGDQDLHFFNEGSHYRLYQKLGAHPAVVDGEAGTHFGVWAPNARRVSVIGDFNGWRAWDHELKPRGGSGIWTGFIPGVKDGAQYKYVIDTVANVLLPDKTDPFAFRCEGPPGNASIVSNLDYSWGDRDWMQGRRQKNGQRAPISIYEVHLGSWMRVPDEGGRFLTYRELAEKLVAYVKKTGHTHVELLPIMEHPFYGSWGYQSTGYFAPTHRYGTPQDLMFLVDQFHQNDIGVILDWVPSHFPDDPHGIGYFDGTHLFEHADARQGFHPDWKSLIFNYGRHEVRSFLLSSAFFWLDRYHADGLRVDAVASMLYLDYSRPAGGWVPNKYGGRENLEAIDFLKRFNEAVHTEFPDVITCAEESTAWPMVSRPVYAGGLGFDFKWDMGWMHDTLKYSAQDPVYRRYHHNLLTFRMLYAHHENFILPLSHDEVVHMKGSLISKLPGDHWQQRANLRALHAYMYAQPGKKLLFMGGEIGQWSEWKHDGSLDWHLMQWEDHQGLQRWVADLNRLYRSDPALHDGDCDLSQFSWIDCNDSDQSVISLLRWDKTHENEMAVVVNFTPVPRVDYRLGVPRGGRWTEALNSDSEFYGGSGMGNGGAVDASALPHHGHPFSLRLTLPPLGALFLKAPPVT
jgi:1,4-alpha-glucan branching enzyme